MDKAGVADLYHPLPLTYFVHPLGPLGDVPAGMILTAMLTLCQPPTPVLFMTMLPSVTALYISFS